MSAPNPLARDRRRDAKLRAATDHYTATWRSVLRHLNECQPCRDALVRDDSYCVACDTGRMVRGEWAAALARKTELDMTRARRATP